MDEYEEIDGMEEFEGMNEDDFMDEMYSETVTSFVKTASKAATKLTALIIENNRHNDKKMTTEDIYQIYSDSFTVAMASISSVEI
jgi:hypothetical protein